MLTIITILFCAFLNRLRGGGWFAPKLPARKLFWVAPCIGAIACAWLPWRDAALFGVAYLAWAWPAWGRWYDLGHKPELERERGAFERVVEAVSFGNDHAAFTLRMAIVCPFLAYFWWPLAIIFPFACTAIYELAWRLWPDTDDDDENLWVGRPITKAEMMTGALWGAFLISIGA